MDAQSGSTSSWEYLDFDLEIRKGDLREYSVIVHSPAGEAQEQMIFPFDERMLRDRLRDLEFALLRSGGTRRSLSREELTVQEFGRSLFETLLVGDVRTRYLMSLDKAEQQDKGLRMKLRVQPPELAVLPWEFLYDPDRDYLCFSPDTPIVRYVDLRQPVRRLTVKPPLRILGMVASPRGLNPLDVEHEKDLMNEAIEELRDEGLVELTWLEGQTWRDLRRAMRRGGPWHVFHFVGHGDFDVAREEGAIALTDGETGREHLLRSRDLARLLDGHRHLRLVFLNSCEGARGSEGDPFSGTAATLVHNRIPAVVAMQYEITDKAAIEFSRSFYEALVDGWPVDAAVTDARVAVSMDSMLEWGTPVLYMRSPDGRLFDISTETRRADLPVNTEVREEALRQYREDVESMWADSQLKGSEVEWLSARVKELELNVSEASTIEHEVMGEAKEAILEHQEQISKEKERRDRERQARLDELYEHARRSHEVGEWQAVIDVFEQIRAEDSDYPDRERFLASAREAQEMARKVQDTIRRYREAVEWAWVDEDLNRRGVRRLTDFMGRLELNPNTAADIEREIMGKTKESILERQEQASAEQYRKALEEAWADNELSNKEAEWLSTLASELGLSNDTAANTEHEVMGDSLSAILHRQRRLDELYAQARQLHQDQEWQMVIDIFERIHSEEPDYPDSEGLLSSSREALDRVRKIADLYDQAVRHVDSSEWQQALERFEEVQWLDPGYKETEQLLSRVRRELEPPSTAQVPDLTGKTRDEEAIEVRQAASSSLGDPTLFDELTRVCAKYTGLSYYVDEAIPRQTLAIARRSIPIPTGERVIALVDNSSVLSRGIGLAVCGDGIRWRNYAENPVSKKIRGFLEWAEFADVAIRRHQWAAEYGVEMGRDNVFVAWKNDTIDQRTLVKLLEDIQALVQRSEKSPS